MKYIKKSRLKHFLATSSEMCKPWYADKKINLIWEHVPHPTSPMHKVSCSCTSTCHPCKHSPPTYKYLILPNPDRKCPRQWSWMLLTDPRRSHSLSLSLGSLLLPPSCSEWYTCPPRASSHLETVSLWTSARGQWKHVYHKCGRSAAEWDLDIRGRGNTRQAVCFDSAELMCMFVFVCVCVLWDSGNICLVSWLKRSSVVLFLKWHIPKDLII